VNDSSVGVLLSQPGIGAGNLAGGFRVNSWNG